ncbi:hypothetical protein [Kocuria sp. cx-455]|uniref:hypothetical protein n=1 Tax=Kocuria sp. cx-455 TaxID=2771377 RepID=UPI003D7465BF
MPYVPTYPSPAPQKKKVWPWVLAAIGAVLVLMLTLIFGIAVGKVQSSPAQTSEEPAGAAASAASGNESSAAAEPGNPAPTLDFRDVEVVELTDRGTLAMKPGASALNSSPEHGELASMLVHSIEVDPVCTGPYVQAPKNGHFVVMDVSVKVASHKTLNAAGISYPSVSMRQGGFRAVDNDGKVTPGNDIIGNSYGCLPEGTELPRDINAGEKASGKIIFDVPSAEGVIVLPELLESPAGMNGWEWAYPVH